MSNVIRAVVCLALVTSSAVPALQAQQPTKPAAPAKPAVQTAEAPPVPDGPVLIAARLHFVLSKYQGQKKISNHPYELQVNGNSRETARIRMLSDVPYPVDGSGGHTFKTVGTTIDASVRSAGGDTFRVDVTVGDSAIVYSEDATPGVTSRVPRTRNFSATNTILLKDGQTRQMIAATDPISGEVMRVDVTLTLLK